MDIVVGSEGSGTVGPQLILSAYLQVVENARHVQDVWSLTPNEIEPILNDLGERHLTTQAGRRRCALRSLWRVSHNEDGREAILSHCNERPSASRFGWVQRDVLYHPTWPRLIIPDQADLNERQVWSIFARKEPFRSSADKED